MVRAKVSCSIHKFGGAALADSVSIRRAVEIFRDETGPKVAVVSAMAGVTDALLEVGARALAGDEIEALAIVERLRERHLETAQALAREGRDRDALLAEIAASFSELGALARGLAILRELSPRTSDAIVARGELLSSRLFAAALTAAGDRARWIEPGSVIVTDGRYGNASPDLAATDRAASRVLSPLLARGISPVVAGFLGASPEGRLATLGRGGTDLTATMLGRALDASRVVLWKDVPGLLTADPRIVPAARVLPKLDLREAAELAYYGAKVLHPRALIPLSTPLGGAGTEARGAPPQVRLIVKPFADPEAPGTEISALGRPKKRSQPVRALSAVRGQALVTVAGSGMLGVPGIAARTFGALHYEGISVSLISQASSEHSICFAVPRADSERARVALSEAFRDEIARREIDGVEVRAGVATLAVVGLGMPGTPGTAARTFRALAESEINVVAIAQGSSELNLSMVVDDRETEEALRRIHAAFQLDKIGGGHAHARPSALPADVVLLGFGAVGRELALLLAKLKDAPVRVVAVIDRSGYVFRPHGIPSATLRKLAEAKAEGGALAAAPGGHAATPEAALAEICRHALARPILADLTAEETAPLLASALEAGMRLALANKRPLSGPRREAAELLALARALGRDLRFETTVGAGLPVMDTYRKLLESGDRIERIEGCFSGTLGFLLTEVSLGRRFSEALRAAMAAGFTEPDPRDDLSGMDVARKALILGRLLGFDGEIGDVAVEPLAPAWTRDLSREEFLARLPELDPIWKRRGDEARAKGEALRYVATVTRRKLSVALVAVPATSSFAALHGTANQVVFTTARYKTNPLVITGPGAGLGVTAAGVLNDLFELAGEP
ncbi:MAG TPA: aspartate kinase [Thermoanaerobaculia bacterium]|jgi:aspartokinase/homoserine dehydrogenase 1|nr:aspartate kinase [Thermoanaerobaculia bacterium]